MILFIPYVQGIIHLPPSNCFSFCLRRRFQCARFWGYSVSYGANLILDDYSAKCLIDITDSKNIHISGLMLNANRNPNSKTHGIMFDKKGKPRNSDTDTITIEDC